MALACEQANEVAALADGASCSISPWPPRMGKARHETPGANHAADGDIEDGADRQDRRYVDVALRRQDTFLVEVICVACSDHMGRRV